MFKGLFISFFLQLSNKQNENYRHKSRVRLLNVNNPSFAPHDIQSNFSFLIVPSESGSNC